MGNTNKTGDRGEEIAARFLISKGYRIRHSNWRSGRNEIDLVAENDSVVCFVECKTRTSGKYGSPVEMLSRQQEQRLMDCADAYIEEFEIEKEVRFDLIGVLIHDEIDIEHIEGAFMP